MIMEPTTASKSPRRRGAPVGNHNALRHGFYSHAFTRRERERLQKEVAGEFRDEEFLLGVIIDRAWQAIQESDMPYDEWLDAVRTISQAIGRKESLSRTRRLIFHKTFTVQDAVDELAAVPFEED
jgi:hypothetical protein